MMPNPRNIEPGALSGQEQQPQSINFSSAVPIKKRRFPIFQQVSPSQEEKSPSPEEKLSFSEDNNLKTKQESNITNEELLMNAARITDYPVTVDVNKTSGVIAREENVATSVELTQANMDIFAPIPQKAKAVVSLGSIDDLGNKVDILVNENSAAPKPDVPKGSVGAYNMNVQQEIVSGQPEGASGLELSTGVMHVELSLGSKAPHIQIPEQQNSDPICSESYNTYPSLLRLALSKKKLVMHEKRHGAIDNARGQVCANRSNWDLNTTMDVWGGSTNDNDATKSSLTTAGTVGLGRNKVKHIFDDQRSKSSSASVQSLQHCKTDDSLGLRLAIPYTELGAFREHSALSNKQVELSATNVSRIMKAEPLEGNSKYDCSLCSRSSSCSRGVPKLSPVKREIVENHNRVSETVLPSISPEKVVDHRSVKLEVIHGDSQESTESLPFQSIKGAMQHQESCASSSVISTIRMPQNLSLGLSTCSDLTISEGVSNKYEHSLHSKVEHDHNDICDEPIAAIVSESLSQDAGRLSLCQEESVNAGDPRKCEMTQVDEHTPELDRNDDLAANDEEKINISVEMLEEDSFGSDSESRENTVVDSSMDRGENVCLKEDEEFEDGEVRETLQHSGEEDRTVEGKKTVNLEAVECDSRRFEPSVLLNNQESKTSYFDGKIVESEYYSETDNNQSKECATTDCEAKIEKSLWSVSCDQASAVGDDEKRSVSAVAEKQLDVAGAKNAEECTTKEASIDGAISGSRALENELGDEGTDKVVNEICAKKNDLTLSKSEASIGSRDAANDSNNARNKSRIINLPRASVVRSPCMVRSIPDKLTSLSVKERHSIAYGRMQSRGNRDEICCGGPNKFAKDRAHDQSSWHSRPSFMPGKWRASSRFGSLRNQWDADHDFAPQTYNNPPAHRATRHKHVSSMSDVEHECNGFGIAAEGTAFSSGRRKGMNDEYPAVSRASLRKLSPGDRDAPRGIQTFHRVPRNIGPIEDGSGPVEPRHGEKFVRHSSDDIIDPVYTRQEHVYDELDGQLVRGNRNLSSMHRKGYPRIRSKSPVRSRSPGPWSSPRRRSPNGLPELKQHKSPALYRTGKARSPDQACFRDEMVTRTRGSPSYGVRHPNDLRGMKFGREHVHSRPANSSRRSPPARVFQRSSRIAEALDSREMEGSDEYINGPLHPNKFHELRGDGSIGERRKFFERRGPPRSFRPNYGVDSDNFRFHMNHGPSPYRFCPDADADAEFVERSNMHEREFDGQIKHQSLVVSRQMRNIEEQHDVNYPPGIRVWNDDGFTDVSRVKRRRF